MEFVKNDQANACQFGIVLQHPSQNTLGHNQYPGTGRFLAVEPNPVAYLFTCGFSQLAGHKHSGIAGGQTTRFEHDNLLSGEPGCCPQR